MPSLYAQGAYIVALPQPGLTTSRPDTITPQPSPFIGHSYHGNYCVVVPRPSVNT